MCILTNVPTPPAYGIFCDGHGRDDKHAIVKATVSSHAASKDGTEWILSAHLAGEHRHGQINNFLTYFI